MPEDLNISEQNDQEVDAEIEFTTREEIINVSCYALTSVLEVTTLTEADERRKKRITKKCLRMIDQCIGEYYSEMFEENKDEEEE